MHGKSYHIEVNERVLERHFDKLHNIQSAMEEMAESRANLANHDAFLTTIADQLFLEIERLQKLLKMNCAGGEQ